MTVAKQLQYAEESHDINVWAEDEDGVGERANAELAERELSLDEDEIRDHSEPALIPTPSPGSTVTRIQHVPRSQNNGN